MKSCLCVVWLLRMSERREGWIGYKAIQNDDTVLHSSYTAHCWHNAFQLNVNQAGKIAQVIVDALEPVKSNITLNLISNCLQSLF